MERKNLIQLLSAIILICIPVVPSLAANSLEAMEMNAKTCHYFRPDRIASPEPNPLIEAMTLPERFDWREQGGYTEAKDQGSSEECYPCWSYALIGAAESAIKIATGNAFDLSEQQLLDCNTKGYGCDGGFISGWTALRDYGAVLDSCYPYIAQDGDCSESDCEPVGWISGVYPVPYTINSLKYALMHHGALSCSMTVYQKFMFYKEGCFQKDGSESINHGVIIVGWDDTLCDGDGAWMVKNSWGTEWGDGGVAYMKYDTCNIGKDAQWFEYSPEAPSEEFHYRLFMPDTRISSGEWFVLERNIGNPTTEKIDFQEILVLDILGEYWFFPELTQEFNATNGTLKPDKYSSDVLLSFVWPEGIADAIQASFIGGCLTDSGEELLAWDRIDWQSI